MAHKTLIFSIADILKQMLHTLETEDTKKGWNTDMFYAT